ncbi:hypothetical protein LHV56_12065 [Peribacillus frigoritolerans]|uniref:hypothetical protein n=1 Tax=Peribacillus frigoritolerans TaxID=450367 RepID=UPI0020796504|nr:hypothetical protein [Peribacillus frigoritolerans]USK82568.1 hypothetical protein LHV56_12065 [Peribacillus frigoritolerans]
MDDKNIVTFFINDALSSFYKYRNKKLSKYPETEKSIQNLIKNNNEVVFYEIKNKSISLHFYDGVNGTNIEFYIDEKENIQARSVPPKNNQSALR